MSARPTSTELVMSMVRSLWGNVYPQLRAASIQNSETGNTICIRFEYEGEPTEEAREACECAVTEIIADFGAANEFDVQHVIVPIDKELKPLKSLVFMRGESGQSA